MNISLLPGYSNLFGSPSTTYEELLDQVPSRLVISTLIIINAELTAEIPNLSNQYRIISLLTDRFSQANKQKIYQAYSNFWIQVNNGIEGDIFGTRYLIGMLIKELNRNNCYEKDDTTPDDEYAIFMAYLMIIDDINNGDEVIVKNITSLPIDQYLDYRLCWVPNIIQFEYTDQPMPAFNLYKLFALGKYIYHNHREALKQYLTSLGFINLSEFLGSFIQLTSFIAETYPFERYCKISSIVPMPGIDESHLQSLCINPLIAIKLITLSDVKKQPLYELKVGKYFILEPNMLLKKLYLGPFFELYHQTILKKEYKFNSYSTEISSEVLEKSVFQNIISKLKRTKHTELYFDDGSDHAPDAYYRKNKSIFLIEFKGYIVPETLSSNSSFEDIKQYIDSKFIVNEKGKSKGITQLKEQIVLLQDGKFNFDATFNRKIKDTNYTIYPIICHTDYYFSMPGVNDYLNSNFKNLLKSGKNENVHVKDLLLVDLGILFRLVLSRQSFDNLEELINKYYRIMKNRQKNVRPGPLINHLYRSKASFDELYRSKFVADQPTSRIEDVAELNKLIDLSDDILTETI